LLSRAMPKYRNRIKGFRTVNARDIRENPQNFRGHPDAQRAAVTDLLQDVGMVDVLKVVEDENGDLLLVDGHLRRELAGNSTVQVAVLDLTPEETKRVLAAFDATGDLAEVDSAALDALLRDIAAQPLATTEQLDVDAVKDAMASAEEHRPEGYETAKTAANYASRHFEALAEQDPQALSGAIMVIVPTTQKRALLVLTDPDLEDIIDELKLRHEQGETHPLDRLFDAIWEPTSA
jgi:hypothetical protein